jgi:hypothetical protein
MSGANISHVYMEILQDSFFLLGDSPDRGDFFGILREDDMISTLLICSMQCVRHKPVCLEATKMEGHWFLHIEQPIPTRTSLFQTQNIQK